MGESTEINWTDATFNPWIGCQSVAPECDNCYAEARDNRFNGGAHWGPKAPRHRTSIQNWKKPLRWNKKANQFFDLNGRRQRVFCASLADVFDNAVDPAWRTDLFDLIRECDNLDWQLLTKRPQNMVKMLPADWGDGWSNVWLGTSAGTQKTADQNIPHLLNTPAAIRFVSAEPLLGAVDLQRIRIPEASDGYLDCLIGEKWVPGCGSISSRTFKTAKLNWVICGGESGPNARPMQPGWARSLRYQCVAAGVPYFFKQWGEWKPLSHQEMDKWWPKDKDSAICLSPDGSYHIDGCRMQRVGTKAAGRALDGRVWDKMPEVKPCP